MPVTDQPKEEEWWVLEPINGGERVVGQASYLSRIGGGLGWGIWGRIEEEPAADYRPIRRVEMEGPEAGTEVKDLPLKPQTRTKLYNLGLFTVAAIRERGRDELRRAPDFGMRALADVEQAIGGW